jgi:DNA-binding MurR/RpiR family transcriptional regulator
LASAGDPEDNETSQESGEQREGKEMEVRFFQRCQETEGLSPSQRAVCDYILKNTEKVAFMTVEQLALAVGTSTATIIRTVDQLGYPSYKSMKGEITHLLIDTKPPTRSELESSWADDRGNTLVRVARGNAGSIEAMLTPYLLEQFPRAVSILTEAKRIAIMGLRSNRGLATYFFTLLREFHPAVLMVGGFGSDEMYEDLLDLGKSDAFFCFSYSSAFYAGRVIEASRFLRERETPQVLLTDSLKNPLTAHAKAVLHVPCPHDHFSLAPAMSVLDALLADIGRKAQGRSRAKLRSLWKIVTESEIAVRSESRGDKPKKAIP